MAFFTTHFAAIGIIIFTVSQARVKNRFPVELSKPMVNCSTGGVIDCTGTVTVAASKAASRIGFMVSSTPHGYCLALNITCHVLSLGMLHKVYFPALRVVPFTCNGRLVLKVVASLAPVRHT